jgi:UDP-N-acetylmuramoyl-tripeptide--D-alanyl-D-alanine ligase
MKAALDTLVELARGHQSLAVLGTMLELGEDSARYHFEVGQHAATVGLHRLIVVGPEAAMIAEGAKAAGFPATRISEVLDPEQAAAAVVQHATKEAWILVKASRGARLERVLNTLNTLPQEGKQRG